MFRHLRVKRSGERGQTARAPLNIKFFGNASFDKKHHKDTSEIFVAFILLSEVSLE